MDMAKLIVAACMVWGVLGVMTARADLELALPLVDKGKSDFVVVLRPDPGTKDKAAHAAWLDEKAAADDFVRLLTKMTGVKLTIVPEAKDGRMPVFIGASAEQLIGDYKDVLKNPDPLALVNDRLLIKADLGGIAIVGGRPWATRLAVTQFFEDLGCRWSGFREGHAEWTNTRRTRLRRPGATGGAGVAGTF